MSLLCRARKIWSLSAATIRRETIKAVWMSICASTLVGNLSRVGLSIQTSIRGDGGLSGAVACGTREQNRLSHFSKGPSRVGGSCLHRLVLTDGRCSREGTFRVLAEMCVELLRQWNKGCVF